MSNTIFEATYFASQQITATFDMVWALDAGLWNLRQDAKKYFIEHPDANNIEVKNALVSGLDKTTDVYSFLLANNAIK